MDWATFFRENSQSLFTLGGVFLGSLITFFISYLNNRFQAKERDKDRQEQRREAKIQLEEDLTRTAIKSIEDAIDKNLNEIIKARESYLDTSAILYKLQKGLISIEEAKNEDKLSKMASFNLGIESTQMDAIALRHAYSLGGKFFSEYKSFIDMGDEFTKSFSFLKNFEDFDEKYYDEELYYKVLESAGNLQTMLRDKLISVRDT